MGRNRQLGSSEMKFSELQRMLQDARRKLDERRKKTNILLDQVKMEYEGRIQEIQRNGGVTETGRGEWRE